MPHVIRPTSDLGFKKILASDDHKTITQGFIADVFGLQVSVNEIDIRNPYSIKAYEEHIKAEGVQQRLHQTLRDITISVNAVDVTVELQICREISFVKRAYYYMADLYTSHYHQGFGDDRYASLRPVWSVNILGEPMFTCAHPWHMFTLHDTVLDEPLVPQLARLGFFELSKMEEVSPQLTRWRNFLNSGVADDTDPSYLQEAASIISYVNLSRKERAMDKLLEKAIATREAEMHCAMEEGRVEGARDARLANAMAALRMGISHADVAQITGLDAATVDELAQQMETA